MSSEVEVYDSVKLSFTRRLNLTNMVRPQDIGSCNINKCLYIFDYRGHLDESNEIMRVDSNGNLIKNWSTGDDTGNSLSVTEDSNVILTVYHANRLNEYSSDGLLIRAINMSSDALIQNPRHAVKLNSNRFVVSHGARGNNLHRVCIVDADGKQIKSFAETRRLDIGQMNCPVYLSVDANGFVLVADQGNSRVLLLDSNLKLVGEILSEQNHGLRRVWRILLDSLNNRLLVAEDQSGSAGRVMIFQL